MPRAWIGPARYLFIPVIIEGAANWPPPPADFVQRINRRIFFDYDNAGKEDNSLLSYFDSVSYGRASIDATVAEPVTVRVSNPSDNPTLLAIQAHPQAHLFEYLAVVYPLSNSGGVFGMAQPGRIEFNPPRSPNRTLARSRFRIDESLGTWAMEIMHNVTDIGDYYNGLRNNPGNFDEMSGAGATHPSAYTKLITGWVDQDPVQWHRGGGRNYTLHAIGLGYPAAGPRRRGVRIRQPGSERYMIAEARLRVDRWDGGSSASVGIPREGVVIYEFAPESDPWPRDNPTGPWPPLELREVLGVGERYSHPQTGATIAVRGEVPGGYSIRVETVDVAVPFVQELSPSVASSRLTAAGLVANFTGETGGTWVWRQSPQPGTCVERFFVPLLNSKECADLHSVMQLP